MPKHTVVMETEDRSEQYTCASDTELFELVSTLTSKGGLYIYYLDTGFETPQWRGLLARDTDFTIHDYRACYGLDDDVVLRITDVMTRDYFADPSTFLPFRSSPIGSSTNECSPSTTIETTPKPKVEVFTPDGQVACPGLPLKLRARGTPEGGKYLWILGEKETGLTELQGDKKADEIALVAAGGEQSTWKGNVRTIEGRTVTVRVCYVPPDNEYVSAEVDIAVHPVEIHVLKTNIRKGSVYTTIKEDLGLLVVGGEPEGVEGIYDYDEKQPDFNAVWNDEAGTDIGVWMYPQLKVVLPGCAAMPACRKNHAIGWLQVVETARKEAIYPTGSQHGKLKQLPVRDAEKGHFFSYQEISKNFGDEPDEVDADDVQDNDSYFIHFVDCPGFSAMFELKEVKLQRLVMDVSFRAWPSVMNLAVAKVDRPRATVALFEVQWSVSIDVPCPETIDEEAKKTLRLVHGSVTATASEKSDPTCWTAVFGEKCVDDVHDFPWIAN